MMWLGVNANVAGHGCVAYDDPQFMIGRYVMTWQGVIADMARHGWVVCDDVTI